MNSTKKVAIVTAGGSGLGAASAKALAEAGFNVTVMSPSERSLALADELGGLGFQGSSLKPEDIKACVDLTLKTWGRIDVIVNSAGHGPKGDLLSISDEDWHLGADYYLMNVIRIARLVTPIMQQQGGGALINISSYAVYEPDSLFPTSSVFRAGLAAFTKLYAEEYAKDNIRMNNVLPGFIDSLPETTERKARIPMGRYGKSSEISGLVSYLASDAGGYITGQNITVDGGLTKAL
jgi:NAD(P)-dependent dehydrogenase (short-subunit alcohol dehydrogenase family)